MCKPGESIALVGPTGAGKTTVVNLISRFYNVNEGRLLNWMATISPKSPSTPCVPQMGIMLQDSFIFSGTILDNIRYGRLGCNRGRESLRRQKPYAHMILSWRWRMDTIRRSTNAEAGLSQGQKQLIAFARTLLSDPQYSGAWTKQLLLSTPRRNAFCRKACRLLLKGRTSFIIAHRSFHNSKTVIGLCMYAIKGISESGSHAAID